MLQVTTNVVREFAADNVKYVELRTTPRDVPATRMTKSSYVASVVAAINAAVSSEHDIIVRLLLAIDRRMSPTDVEETLKLAESYASRSDSVVVGLDLSGDPMVSGHCVLIAVSLSETCNLLSTHLISVVAFIVAVWCSGNALVLINAVALHRARLVLGWVTAFG